MSPFQVWSLILFDNDVRQYFKDCFILDTSDSTWQQAQLSLCYGGLGLRSLSHHSSAAFIVSVCSSSFDDRDNQAINRFYIQVLPSDAISVEFSYQTENFVPKTRLSSVPDIVSIFFSC